MSTMEELIECVRRDVDENISLLNYIATTSEGYGYFITEPCDVDKELKYAHLLIDSEWFEEQRKKGFDKVHYTVAEIDGECYLRVLSVGDEVLKNI